MNPSVNSSAPGDSSPETSDATDSVSAGIDDAFRWNVRPSDKEPGKRWGVLAGAVLAFAFGMVLFGNVLLGLLGFAIIVASTAEFWLGTSYTLDSAGASVRCGFSYSQMAWTEVKRVVTTTDGVKLSPLAKPTRMDGFRGLFLKYGVEDRQRILGLVRRFAPKDAGLLE